MSDPTPPPELTQEQLEAIEAYAFGARFDTTGRPFELKIPKDLALQELIDLAFWILRPDGLRQAIDAMDAKAAAAIAVPARPNLVGLDGRPVS